ncbi:MAG: hypothetical protein AAF460_12160, partial [Pseudomonadota bacterium]
RYSVVVQKDLQATSFGDAVKVNTEAVSSFFITPEGESEESYGTSQVQYDIWLVRDGLFYEGVLDDSALAGSTEELRPTTINPNYLFTRPGIGK